MKNTALRNALVTLGSFIFVVSIVSAEPWKAPTGAPPTNNVSAPITIGADQIKSGALQLAALKSLGGVQIGTTTAACKSQPPEENTSGTLRWYKGVMEYCNGTAWVPFGGGTETDPTVLTSVKDGVSWSEVTGKPSDMVPSGTTCGLWAYTQNLVFSCAGHDPSNSCPSGWTRAYVGPNYCSEVQCRDIVCRKI